MYGIFYWSISIILPWIVCRTQNVFLSRAYTEDLNAHSHICLNLRSKEKYNIFITILGIVFLWIFFLSSFFNLFVLICVKSNLFLFCVCFRLLKSFSLYSIVYCPKFLWQPGRHIVHFLTSHLFCLSSHKINIVINYLVKTKKSYNFVSFFVQFCLGQNVVKSTLVFSFT